jgi:stress up-regulated protein Nod 19
VLFNTGRDVRAPICQNSTIEIIYTNGNEKSIGYYGLNNATVKSGYPVSDSDKFVLNTQLMNMEDKEKYVWVTLTYHYIPDAKDLREARLHWMTLGNVAPAYCSGVSKNPWGKENVTSDLIPLSEAFEQSSIPMPYPTDGLFYGASAHLHDGGTSVEIYQNLQMVCNSVPTYGKSAGGHAHGGDTGEHIISQSGCKFYDPTPVKRGDKFWMKVRYDFNKHPG